MSDAKRIKLTPPEASRPFAALDLFTFYTYLKMTSPKTLFLQEVERTCANCVQSYASVQLKTLET